MLKHNKILVRHLDGTDEEVLIENIMQVVMTNSNHEDEKNIRKTLARCFHKKRLCQITTKDNDLIEIDAQHLVVLHLLASSKVVLRLPDGSEKEVCTIRDIKMVEEIDPSAEN